MLWFLYSVVYLVTDNSADPFFLIELLKYTVFSTKMIVTMVWTELDLGSLLNGMMWLKGYIITKEIYEYLFLIRYRLQKRSGL